MVGSGRFFLFLIPFALSFGVQAQDPDDPVVDPGESFQHFVQKITKDGTFGGLNIPEASDGFFKSLVMRLRHGGWVGEVDTARKEAIERGANYWGEWNNSQKVLKIVFPTEKTRQEFYPYFENAEKSLSSCLKICRGPATLEKTDWKDWRLPEISAFTVAYVQTAKIFGGKTLSEHLGEVYKSDTAEALGKTDLRILNDEDFKKAVKEAGWTGEIYFRAATFRDPANSQRRIILLNSDLMKKVTSYSSPFLQLLEYSGILTHETSHVFQDQEARRIGIAELEPSSFESLMLLEGNAEYLAEAALKNAAATQKDFPSSLKIFVSEVALEVVYRKTNDRQMMPYSLGLPFARTLSDVFPQEDLEEKVLQTIQGNVSFKDLLF